MPMEPFETGAHLSEDMSMFEAAVHAHATTLVEPALSSILLAYDGSNQDGTAEIFARLLASRSGARVHELRDAVAAADILKASEANRADLIVLPVPFRRDIDVLKDESLGSVVDMVLLESACPVLCVRQLLDEAAATQALSNAIVPVTLIDEREPLAASWALRLLQSGNNLNLLALADEDLVAGVRKLLGDSTSITGDALTRVLTHEEAGLFAAVQKRGQAAGIHVHVDIKAGRVVPMVLDDANNGPHLVVTVAKNEHSSPSFHRATDLVLGSHGPVLVV